MLVLPAEVVLEFVGQIRHSGRPMTSAYLPTWQARHAEDPSTSLYCPIVQGTHAMLTESSVAPVRAGLPVYPAEQRQSDTASLPAGERDFLGHCVHSVSVIAPVLLRYLPTEHVVHASDPMFVL